MSYDAATGTIVLFGGDSSTGDLGDTWTWNGSTWTKQHPATRPAVRFEAAMAYDAAASNVVLFSGIGGTGLDGIAPLRNTWTWGG